MYLIFYAFIHTLVLSQAFLTAQEKEAQELAALELQQRLEELLRKNEEAAKSQTKEDEEMVENLFGFIPSALGGQEGPAPEGFEVSVILTVEQGRRTRI